MVNKPLGGGGIGGSSLIAMMKCPSPSGNYFGMVIICSGRCPLTLENPVNSVKVKNGLPSIRTQRLWVLSDQRPNPFGMKSGHELNHLSVLNQK